MPIVRSARRRHGRRASGAPVARRRIRPQERIAPGSIGRIAWPRRSSLPRLAGSVTAVVLNRPAYRSPPDTHCVRSSRSACRSTRLSLDRSPAIVRCSRSYARTVRERERGRAECTTYRGEHAVADVCQADGPDAVGGRADKVAGQLAAIGSGAGCCVAAMSGRPHFQGARAARPASRRRVRTFGAVVLVSGALVGLSLEPRRGASAAPGRDGAGPAAPGDDRARRPARADLGPADGADRSGVRRQRVRQRCRAARRFGAAHRAVVHGRDGLARASRFVQRLGRAGRLQRAVQRELPGPERRGVRPAAGDPEAPRERDRPLDAPARAAAFSRQSLRRRGAGGLPHPFQRTAAQGPRRPQAR